MIASGIAFGGAIVDVLVGTVLRAVLVGTVLRGGVCVLPGCIGCVIIASGIDPGGAMEAVRGFWLVGGE